MASCKIKSELKSHTLDTSANIVADQSCTPPAPKRRCKITVIDSSIKETASLKGKGTRASVPAIPYVSSQSKDKTKFKANSKSAWRVLLDSGSDGDILFDHPSDPKDIVKRGRRKAQTYRTSTGTFECQEVGDINLTFPEYSTSKYHSVRPDVYSLKTKDRKPDYDLILGTETLKKLGVVLDFNQEIVTIDKQDLPMRPHLNFSMKRINKTFKNEMERDPPVAAAERKRAERILDAKYEKADLERTVKENCAHLSIEEQSKLLRLLRKHEHLFDGTLGDWDTTPVHFELKEGAKPYHGRAYSVPHVHLATLKKEVERLVKLGVLAWQPSSEWASPTFIIPKKNGTVWFLSNFRKVNQRIVRKPHPIPKLSTTLQEMEGFSFATALDLNMGYYTIRLDPDTQKICTIILPWGKYSYLRLPMGISGSADIFQEKMSDLMASLEYVKAYIDDLLSITKGSFDDHLDKLDAVLYRLDKAGLRINIAKSSFAQTEIEYLGYVLTREGIKPQPEKIRAILALLPPKNVKQVRSFLGMVQFYRDMWEKRSEILAPLTDLVSKCGYTKATKKNGEKDLFTGIRFTKMPLTV